MKLSLFLSLAVCFVCSDRGYSQTSIDTFPKYKTVTVPSKKTPFVQTLLIPSAALLYGAVSLNGSALHDWNRTVQKNVAAAPMNYTNLDDYLQYTQIGRAHV